MTDPRPCRKCKATIQMIEGPSGKAIPAQKVTQLYCEVNDKLIPVRVTYQGKEVQGPYYISHFQTCPAAETFTRNRS